MAVGSRPPASRRQRHTGDAVPRAVRYGALPLVVLAATVAIESGERQSLAQAVDGIQDAFGVSDRALGLLPAALSVVGALGAVPFGVLADRVRRTALIGASVLAWSACMFLNGLAPGYGALFAARLGVGFMEANSNAAVSLMSDYYPVQERAKRMGLYQSGGLVGALIGLLMGGIAVQVAGWRWAFFMWVPVGLVVATAVFRLPEPRRGDHDAEFHVGGTLASTDGSGAEPVPTALPPPTRVGTLDYGRATVREIYRELRSIRSMWFGLMNMTISWFMLAGLQFWGVEYFKRVHHLEAAEAGAFTALFGLSSAAGILGGGFVSDRLLRQGVLNARVYVVAGGSIAAGLILVPAFLSTNLAVTGLLLVLGGVMLTLPVGPLEALVNDVVVAQLRGRAAAFRSIVRSVGAIGPIVIGILSDAYGLRIAIAGLVPVYAVAGLVMLAAARTYPSDLAFATAEARRLREAQAQVDGG